jgi:fucose permease
MAGFAALAAGMFLAGLIEIGPAKWLPSFVAATSAAGQFQGALGLMLFAATMMVGRLASSALVQRLGAGWLMAAGGALCAAGLLLGSMPVPAAATILLLSLVGLGVASMWPTLLGVAGDRFPAAGASMYSLLSAIGSAGAIVGPWMIGLVAEASGSLALAMGVTAAAPVLAILLMLRLKGGD